MTVRAIKMHLIEPKFVFMNVMQSHCHREVPIFLSLSRSCAKLSGYANFSLPHKWDSELLISELRSLG